MPFPGGSTSLWGWSLADIAQGLPAWCESMSCTPNLVAFVLVGGNVDLESQAEGKKEVEADDVMRSGPRPIVPYSSMFCLSPTNL